MNALELINTIMLSVGIPVISAVLISIGKKLQLLDSMQQSMNKIKHNLTAVTDYLIRHHSEFDPKELKVFSPLNLTQVGKNFVEAIGFDSIFLRHKNDFFEFITGESPKLKYDVEIAAIKSISVLSEKPYMAFLKIYFYNHPHRTIDNTAPTLGVFLRDRYLFEHPEIKE